MSGLPFEVEAARGAINGYYFENVYGENADIDTGTDPEDVWDAGGTYVYTVAAGVKHYISSSAADTGDVHIRLLSSDASGDWNLEEFDFTLVGNTKTEIVTPSLNNPVRILSVENVGAAALTGDVYVYEDDTVIAGVPQTATKIRAKVLIGNEKTLMAFTTIPSGKTGFLTQVSCLLTSSLDTKPVLSVYTRPVGGVFRRVVRANLQVAGQFNWQYKFDAPIVLDAQTDVKFTVDSVNVDNTAVGAGFEIGIQG